MTTNVEVEIEFRRVELKLLSVIRFIAGESVYPYILEDYLTYFLPCDGSSVPHLPFQVEIIVIFFNVFKELFEPFV